MSGCGCQKCSYDSSKPSKPFTAKEARKISETFLEGKIDSTVEQAYRNIKREAQNGKTSVSFSITHTDSETIENVMSILKTKGFKVKRDEYSDTRDQWDNLIVEW